MLKEHRIYLTSVDLNFVPPSIEFSDALSLKDYNNSEVADIVTVIHCDGLLLCTTTEGELVVWNPCLGETRWIKHNDGRRCFRPKAIFTLGYENNQSCRCYKIMMLLDWYDIGGEYDQDGEFEIYDFNSNTWRFINSRNCIFNKSEGVTLNGNNYWINIGYLLSFDFTRERFKRWYFPLTSQDYLSWSKSFSLDYGFDVYTSFLIDGDKKVALYDSRFGGSMSGVCTIGEEDEYYTEIPFVGARFHRHPIFIYVPSLVQIQQDNIESDVSGKSSSDGEMRHNDGQFSQEIGIMMSEADEWYWREIECTDFSSRRGSRRRRGWKTRCVTL
uniref:F-box associated beta-propeller type 1 domain-containing protein n=1 Tax=Brassica oleracea var. oleracea TaxID=109376 RepID=A0A0D3ABJ5_BRAOL